MDGTLRKLIVSNVESLGYFTVREKFGFAISPLKKRIFFANFNNAMIESIDYDGNGRAKVAEAKAPLTITVHNETLYWSDAKTSKLKKNYVLLRAKIGLFSYDCIYPYNSFIATIHLFRRRVQHLDLSAQRHNWHLPKRQRQIVRKRDGSLGIARN